MSTCMKHTTSASATKAFVQLASRRATSTQPVLDFLLPTRTTPFPSSTSGSSLKAVRSNLATAQRRAFTASASLKETRCIYNPKRDEDGEFMKIEITPRAAHVCFFRSSRHRPDRIYSNGSNRD